MSSTAQSAESRHATAQTRSCHLRIEVEVIHVVLNVAAVVQKILEDIVNEVHRFSHRVAHIPSTERKHERFRSASIDDRHPDTSRVDAPMLRHFSAGVDLDE